MSTAHAQHAMASTVRDLGRELAGDRPDGLSVRKGQVKAVASDGLSCTVELGRSGVEVPGVRQLAHYTPTVGDWVYLLLAGPLWIIIGEAPTSASTSFDVYDTQTPPVLRVRLGRQSDGRYGLRIWGSNGLINFDYTAA
jgi:hypothetical protein